jgi:predicted DCC family thiol-disulfide oxidoreductase YuxK
MRANQPRTAPGEAPIVFFDGYCNLCNRSVAFIIERDRGERFRFASLDSPTAKARLAAYAAHTPLPDSVLLLDADGLHARSDAASRIARHLTLPWRWVAALSGLIPRVLRNALYDVIARNRLRWFGRRETCSIPTPSQQSRFLP